MQNWIVNEGTVIPYSEEELDKLDPATFVRDWTIVQAETAEQAYHKAELRDKLKNRRASLGGQLFSPTEHRIHELAWDEKNDEARKIIKQFWVK